MYLLIADDLTGGNDAGIQFAKNGIDARLALSAESAGALDAPGDGRMLVINANTRNLPPEDARRRTASVVGAMKDAVPDRPAMVFKKIERHAAGRHAEKAATPLRRPARDTRATGNRFTTAPG